MYYTSRETYEYISQQTNDPILEWKTCSISGQQFPIYRSDRVFYGKISPTFAGRQFQVPDPTLCPEERQRRRMAWRNERYLFRRKCNATGKDVISMYPPDTPFPVYTADVWWGDSRNGLDYGFDFDHEKTFTEQFKVLLDRVPRLFMYNLNSENSDYSNCSTNMKNCYLVTAGLGCEDCYYGNYMYDCKDSVDNFMVFDASRIYSCVECIDCVSCYYCYNTYRSKNSFFLTNCDDCYSCFGCVNLVRKQYCWFNEQLTKEEYVDRLSRFDSGSHQQVQHMKVTYQEFLKQHPRSANMSMRTEGCLANYSVTNSKNCSFCFDITNVEDCKYSYRWRGGKDCYDVFSRGSYGERMYECSTTGDNVSNCIACQGVDSDSSFCFYSTACSSSHHLFGCNGLKNAEYCIFNKQYTKEDREEEVANIIETMKQTGERGEMLDQGMSVFGYNYTVAQEFAPLDKHTAERMNYHWSDYEAPAIASAAIIQANDLSDNIDKVQEDICTQVISCSQTGKLYRITRQEYDFYKTNHVPLPRSHPDQRFASRLLQRPPRSLYLRTCDKTGEQIVSVYPPDTPFPVYSEEAYKQEIYG